MSETGLRRRSTITKFTWDSAPSLRLRLLPPCQGVAPHVLVLRLARGHARPPLLACVPFRPARALLCVPGPRSAGRLLLVEGPRRGHRHAILQRVRSHPGAHFGLRSRTAPKRALRRRETSGRTPLNGAVLPRGKDHPNLVETRRWFYPWLRSRNFLADTVSKGSASLAPSAIISTSTPRPQQRAAARDSVPNRALPPRLKPLLLPRPWSSRSHTLLHHLPGNGLVRLLSTVQCPLQGNLQRALPPKIPLLRLNQTAIP